MSPLRRHVPTTDVPYALEWSAPGNRIQIVLQTSALKALTTRIVAGDILARGLLLGVDAPQESGSRQIRVEAVHPLSPDETLQAGLEKWPSGPDRRMWAIGAYSESSDGGEKFARKLPAGIDLLLAIRTDVLQAVLLCKDPQTGQGSRSPEFPIDLSELAQVGFDPFQPFGAGAPAPPSRRTQVPPASVFTTDAGTGVRMSPELPAFEASRFTPDAPLPAPTRTGHPILLSAMGGAAVALGIAGIAWWSSRPASTPAASSLPRTIFQSDTPRLGIGLGATRKGSGLEIDWNRGGAWLQDARSGVLSIVDGSWRKTIPLDRQQLETARVVYVPRTGDVQVRFDVSTSGPPLQETLSVIEPDAFVPTAPQRTVPGTKEPEARIVPVDQAERSRTVTTPEVQAAPPVHPPALPAERRVVQPPARKSEVASVALTPAPHDLQFAPTGPIQAPAISLTSLPAPARPPSLTVRSSPVPLRQAPVLLPSSLQKLVTTQTVIDVTVTIDPKGKVSAARTSPESGLRGLLAEHAKSAARLWTFTPAQVEGKPTQGEYVIKFKF